MRWVRRIGGVLAVVVVMVVLVASVGGVVAVRRSFPDVDGIVAVRGLTGEVRVERDELGVPTIIASDVDDLFLAQGFVHAQDRFWEMDLRRHVTAGRLSELFGASQLGTDRFIRTLGWRRVAEAEVELVAPETRRMLEAYATGVNAWMDGRRGSALSLEHALLPVTGAGGYRPEPWTAADSLAWLKAMAWDLRSNMETELERARMLGVDLGPGRTWEDLYPAFDADRHPTILPWGGAVVGDAFVPATGEAVAPTTVPAPVLPAAGGDRSDVADTRSIALDPAVQDALAATWLALASSPSLLGDGAASGVGSNSWVIAGSRSASGAPLLANDPHLAPAMPSIWYQVRLRCAPVTDACPYDVAGFSFSGMPGIVIGHNDTIAWGFTNLGPDVADLVVERVRGDQVDTPRGPVPLRTLTETIRVAGGPDETVTIRLTPNGPLLSDVSADLREVAAGPSVPRRAGDAAGAGAEEYAVALRWVALDPAPTADAVPGLMAARSFDAFRRAAARFEVPSQNLVYADREGNIGYQAPGRIPVRNGHDGTLPVAGWTEQAPWVRYLTFDELPYTYNPPAGMIVTANQLVLPPGSTPFLHVDVSFGQRGARIVELLGDRDQLTLDDLAAVQLDNHNANAATLVPYLLAVSGDPRVTAVQTLLTDWDHQDDADSAASAAFNATWRALLARTFHDELPDWAWPSGGGRWWEVVRGLLDDPTSAWWHDEATAVRRTRDDVLVLAMTDAHDELTDMLGSDPDAWRWGTLHTLTLRHGTFGSSGIAPIERLFNRGPLEVAGGTDIVNSNSWYAVDGYEVVWVPSMRMLVDWGDPDGGRWIHLTGQSGRPFHRHYSDQAEPWRDGGYSTMPFTPAATAATASRVLVLQPRR
jgi:penicillin G amidase